jgi:phage-related holin
MKSIILNLLKQGYDFFAVALTTGFIFSFFFPIKHFLLFTIAVVIADTITGIKAARKEGKAITSKGLYRTTEKIVVYFTSILIFHGAQLTFAIPVPIVYLVSSVIAGTELFSVAENVKRITGVNLGTVIVRFFKK